MHIEVNEMPSRTSDTLFPPSSGFSMYLQEVLASIHILLIVLWKLRNVYSNKVYEDLAEMKMPRF